MSASEPGIPSHADPGGRPSQSTDYSVWLRLLTFLNIGVLVALIALLVRGGIWSPTEQAAGAADGEQLKAAAAALEERGLDARAAAAWQRYLDAVPTEPNRAEVLAHMGLLYLRGEKFEEAAAAFVRAELAADENDELKEKAGGGLRQALRAMGRYGAIGRELSRQASRGKDKGESSPVVARIGEQTITEDDLDRMIEHRVDQMLASQDSLGDAARRQTFMRQLSAPQVRAQLLRELVQTELFIRRARELKLDNQLDFLLAREQAIDSLLVRLLLQQELKLAPATDKAMKSFYDSHPAEFLQPESMSILGIRTADAKTAAALQEKIKSADDFTKVAQNPGAGAEAFTRAVFLGRPDSLLGNVDGLFALKEGQWTKEPLANGNQRFLVFVGKKSPARTLPFEEVRSGIQNQFMRQQRQAAIDKLFHDLEARYQAELLLSAKAPKLEGVSPQSEQMLGETVPAVIEPAIPAVQPPEKGPELPGVDAGGTKAPQKPTAKETPAAPSEDAPEKPEAKTP